MFIYKSAFSGILPSERAIPAQGLLIDQASIYLDTWAGQEEELKVVTPQAIKRYAVEKWDLASPPLYISINGLFRALATSVHEDNLSRPKSPDPCRFSEKVFYMGRRGANNTLTFGSTIGMEPVSFVDALRTVIGSPLKTRHLNELTQVVMTNYVDAITYAVEELGGGAGEDGAGGEDGN